MVERWTRHTHHAQAHGEFDHLVEEYTRTRMVSLTSNDRHDAGVMHNLSPLATALQEQWQQTYQNQR